MRKNVLIAGASLGWGHLQAARNIEKAISHIDPTWCIESIDVLDFLPRGVGLISQNAWRLASCYLDNIYSRLYRKSVNHTRAGAISQRLARSTAIRIANELARPPDIYIATHSFAASIGFHLKELVKCRLCVVATDFVLHQMHFSPHVDLYYVPPAYECKLSLGDVNRYEARILDTGIPIDNDFAVEKDSCELRKRFGLSQGLATVLVSFGGSGLRAESHIQLFSYLLSLNLPLQFLVLAGRNARFAKAMRRLYGCGNRYGNLIKIYDFVE